MAGSLPLNHRCDQLWGCRSRVLGAKPRAMRAAVSRRQVHCVAFRDWFAKRASTASSPTDAASRGGSGSKRDFLEARQVSLFELFDGDTFRFDIPNYQRPYQWRSKQVFELLHDLRTAFSSGQEYFLGAIVTTKPGEGVGTPYQVIDGQQRLTTLVMLLARLRHWAAEQPGGAGSSLAQRLGRMLHMDADPLDPASSARYRLHLRPADQQFFEAHVVDAWLPTRFHLSPSLDRPGRGAVAEDEATPAPAAATSALPTPQQQQQLQQAPSQALANEAWWRMYSAAAYIERYLDQAQTEGTALADFLYHLLRNCYVVVMTARDEDASFRIFSSLNGRGVDLSVVDVLKAELLQALPPASRGAYAERWLAMEGALGRPAFHRIFDFIRQVEVVAAAPPSPSAAAAAAATNARTSAGSRAADAHDGWLVGRVPGGDAASGASSSVLEHWRGKAASAEDATLSMDVLFEYAHRLLLIRQNSWRRLLNEGGSGPEVAAELEEVCWYVNLFTDDAWAPWALEFLYQVDDEAKRAEFLRGTELLQLYCEVVGDGAFKQARWHAVGRELLQRPFYSDRVLEALALAPDEQTDMIVRLSSRNLGADVEARTLAHLLLRADSINRRTLDWKRLKVEKILPTHPPEGSSWRRKRILVPDGGAAPSTPDTPDVAAQPSQPSTAEEAQAAAAAEPPQPPLQPVPASPPLPLRSVRGGSGRGSSGGSRRSSSSTREASESAAPLPEGWREVKYWGHEVARAHWHSRLGNLLLVQPSVTGLRQAPSHHNADFEAKAGYWAACGADEHFPEFSGQVISPGGRYAKEHFSPEECRARHSDIVARLVEVWGLGQL